MLAALEYQTRPRAVEPPLDPSAQGCLCVYHAPHPRTAISQLDEAPRDAKREALPVKW